MIIDTMDETTTLTPTAPPILREFAVGVLTGACVSVMCYSLQQHMLHDIALKNTAQNKLYGNYPIIIYMHMHSRGIERLFCVSLSVRLTVCLSASL